MSAPVTKEHCALWNKLYNLAFNECFGGESSDAKATQLIADSEAEAVEAYAASTRELLQSYMTERDQLRAEVERLKKLSPVSAFEMNPDDPATGDVHYMAQSNARLLQHATDKLVDCAKRAERAEAEVKKLTGFYNEIVVECGHDRIVREYRQRGELLRDEANRRKEAEAELANIRALANRRNKRDHSQDTTHQLVAALDQALDIAQAELAAERSRLDYIDSLSPGDAWGIYRSSAQQNANLHAGDPRTLRKLPGIRAAIDAAKG